LSDKLTGIDELLKEYKKEIHDKKESDSFKKGSSQLEQNKQYKELVLNFVLKIFYFFF
jgi:cytoskeletal protein RodZ